MSVRRAAAFSVHTSPLAQPGRGDGGGMNVYVDSMSRALARAGVEVDVFARADDPDLPGIVEVEPGLRVVHIEAGGRKPVAKHELFDHVEEFADNAQRFMQREGDYEVLHAHYWLSGAVAHQLKHRLGVPLVATFHTLARVKAEAGFDDEPELRARTEHEVMRCCDCILASSESERAELVRLYDVDPARTEIVAPGVDHSVFHPDGRFTDRRRLGIDGANVL
jgi:D-inositol-3-phosphate glycosyltransferase